MKKLLIVIVTLLLAALVIINVWLLLESKTNKDMDQIGVNIASNENMISTAYFKSDKIEKEESEEKIIVNKEVELSEIEKISIKSDFLGSAGRLYLPTINLNVGLNYARLEYDENYDAQEIVDRKDSAAYFELGGKYIIADHNYQGFNKLINLEVGTKAYIKSEDNKVITYQLNNKFLGKNTSEDLVDTAGNSVQNMKGSLIMYTCYTSDEDVIITLWDRID